MKFLLPFCIKNVYICSFGFSGKSMPDNNDNNYNAYYYKLFQKADTLLRLRLYHPMRQRYGVPNNISCFCCKLCAEWTLLGL